MDPLLVAMAVALVVGTVLVVLQYRRRPTVVHEDDPRDAWKLPSPTSTPDTGAQPAVFDRESLAHRNRTLDTSAWDNTPDGLVGTDPEDPDEAAAPSERVVLDRDSLKKPRPPAAG